MRIHSKLVSFVVGALVIPFLMGVFYVRHFGKLYCQKQQGIVHLMIAEQLAGTLQDGVQRKFEQVLSWVSVSPLYSMAAASSVSSFTVENIQQVELLWSSPVEKNEVLQTILSNPLSGYIRSFQKVNPEFAEILMTDRYGRLIGATNPTTDYWQADETWWKTASKFAAATGAIQGLLYDESAEVLAIDMVFPVYSSEFPSDFIGVLKVSLHATHFLQRTAPRPWNKEISRDLILPNGRVFAHLNAGDTAEVSKIPKKALQELLTASDGWGTVDLIPDTLSLAAAVPIQITSEAMPFAEETSGTCQLYAVVSRDLSQVMMPVQKMLRRLTIWTILTTILFASLSYLLVTHWFVRPIKKIRNASLSLVDYIKLGEQGRFEDLWEGQQEANRQLDELKTIRSRDELQDLSRDFIRMGERMISFLRQIEEKLTHKKRQ